MNAADRIGDVKLILKFIWNLLRVADDQEVVRNFVRISRARAHALSRKKLVLGLIGPIAVRTGILLIARLLRARLFTPML